MRFWEWRHVKVGTHHLFPTPAAQILCWEAVSLGHTSCGEFFDHNDVQRSDLPRCPECHRLGLLRDQAFEVFSKGSVENALLWGTTTSGRGLHLAPASQFGLCGRPVTQRLEKVSVAPRCSRCLRAAEIFFKRIRMKEP